jgi:hypothetical protein
VSINSGSQGNVNADPRLTDRTPFGVFVPVVAHRIH